MKSYLAPISAFILFSVLAVPAAFSAPPQELLRVTLQGDGEGGVESDPEGIDCPDDCDESYKKNSTVTLTAKADPNSSFLGWNGDGACGGSDPTCEIKLSATTEVIASFEAEATQQLLPATGETLCWPEVSDPPIPCEGTGQDGDIQAGAPLSYTDNGDGTITDNNTKLMWEKKDDSGGVHDKDNTYTFAAALDFADTLNNTCNGEGATECTADNECVDQD